MDSKKKTIKKMLVISVLFIFLVVIGFILFESKKMYYKAPCYMKNGNLPIDIGGFRLYLGVCYNEDGLPMTTKIFDEEFPQVF